MSEEEQQSGDICRVCRCEGTPERPLFHPCICTGSIKFIHQECLVQWLRYSKKEFCELCNHQFSFTPIYSPDMPKRLPIKVIVSGLVSNLARAVRFWMHYTLVAFAWLGVVPLSACRIYRCLFTGSVSSVLTLPLDMISADNLTSDILHGVVVVLCTLCAFIGLVWLREQILHGGGPDWLEPAPVEPENGEPRPQAADGGNAANPQPPGPPDPGHPNQEHIQEENMEGQQRNGVNEEAGWNPMDWDRAAEELTWERLLGLDGSLVFLEHVFWVASLNTLFILVFGQWGFEPLRGIAHLSPFIAINFGTLLKGHVVHMIVTLSTSVVFLSILIPEIQRHIHSFSPYHIGHFAIVGFGMKDQIVASHFDGFLTTVCGYFIIGLAFVVIHTVAAILRLRRVKRIVGLCYVVVKVSLLIVAEIGIFPVICGWWLDICSLSLVDATLKDRLATFRKAPGTSMFLHWLGGIMSVFYFASFVLLLREVVRPGLLWFLRNLNDPEFSPVQEMIHLPIFRHLRRFLMSMMIFGSLVLVIVWVPVNVIKTLLPGFLPFNLAHSIDVQVPEFSLELLVLQVILPCLLEQVHTRQWLLVVLRVWCAGVGTLLGLKSYLLGDGTMRTDPEPQVPPVLGPQEELAPQIFGNRGLGAAHQAFLQREGPIGIQAYDKPTFFPIRVMLMMGCMCATLSFSSILALVIPVSLGRGIMSLLYPEGQPHELYTGFAGLYICWLLVRLGTLIYTWIPEGRGAMTERVKSWAIIGFKSVIAILLLIGVIPFLLGLVLDLVLIVPLRVPLHQTPIYFVAQDWCLGVLYTKIVCAVTMMSPDWWLRHALEQMYQNGLRNLDLNFVIFDLAGPGIVWLGVALACPYVIAHSIVPYFVTNPDLFGFVERRIYPFCFFVAFLAGIIYWQTAQFRRLYEHIRNDRYLVGRRLVNYHRPSNHSQSSALVAVGGRS